MGTVYLVFVCRTEAPDAAAEPGRGRRRAGTLERPSALRETKRMDVGHISTEGRYVGVLYNVHPQGFS